MPKRKLTTTAIESEIGQPVKAHPDKVAGDIDEDKQSNEDDRQSTCICSDATTGVDIRCHRPYHVSAMRAEIVPAINTGRELILGGFCVITCSKKSVRYSISSAININTVTVAILAQKSDRQCSGIHYVCLQFICRSIR